MAVNTFVPSMTALTSTVAPASTTVRAAMSSPTLAQATENINALSNPKFDAGTAPVSNPLVPTGKISRGYIRRANFETGDTLSHTRLNFMYNPETIVRDYVSYLDQAALDPFNTVYGSGNLVAPPSFMNFRFDLFFDRQAEVARDSSHRGVLVDYEYFDMVVRNIAPASQTSNQVPDNGVMMVNPRDITVVFSKDLTVQGRPINAQVVFEKFDHQMTPVRMRIALEMRVVYFGPMRAQTEYVMDSYSDTVADTVAPDESAGFTFTYTDLVAADGASSGAVAAYPSASPAVQDGLSSVAALSSPANVAARGNALQWAMTRTKVGYTVYDRARRGQGLDPSGYLRYTDCSALVWRAYDAMGLTQKMGWGGSSSAPTDSYTMLQRLKAKQSAAMLLSWTPSDIAQARQFFSQQVNRNKLATGDLLFYDKSVTGRAVGHVAFFVRWVDDNFMEVFDAAGTTANPQVGMRRRSREWLVSWNHAIFRPIPHGASSYGSAVTGNPHVGVSYVS